MYARFILATFLLLFSLFLLSCEKDSTSTERPVDYGNIQTIDYSRHVQPLLNEYAQILQSAGVYPPGLQMDSWENLIRGWERGEAVIPFDADNSLLVELGTKLNYNNALDSVKIAFLKRWINEGAKNAAGNVPYADARNLLYVCNQMEAIVSIIDADNLVVIRNVDLTAYGFPRSSKPHHIAFSPDGAYWFVSCIDNQVNKVLKFTVADNQLVGEFSTPIPALLDHHPVRDELYVSRFMDPQNPQTAIAAANSQTMQGADGGTGDILLPASMVIPHAMMLSRSGDYAYTASFAQDAFLVVNTTTKDFEDVIFLSTDATPLQTTVSPDDNTVYVACIGAGPVTGRVLIIDVTDPGNRTLTDSVMVGGRPWHGVFTADGSKFYLGNLMMHKFHVINTADLSFQNYGAGDGSDGLADLHGAEIHPDGSRVFLSSRNTSGLYQPYYDFGDNRNTGTVAVINTADNSIEKIIEIETFGSGMRMLSR